MSRDPNSSLTIDLMDGIQDYFGATFYADTVVVATWDMFGHSDVAEVCIIIVTPRKQSGVISRIQTLPCIPVIPC